MSEFNELVKAFLLGNNLQFEENEKEPNTLILSDVGKGKSFMARVFERSKPHKEYVKLFILDSSSEDFKINKEADIIIWNDSFSGNNLEEKIKNKIEEESDDENKIKIKGKLEDFDSRYMGMGRNILFSKFYGSRIADLLEVAKLDITSKQEWESVFTDEILGKKRFIFIIEETDATQYLNREFNGFMEFFCKEEGPMSQSLPVYFTSLDFWFGGLIHTQLTNRLNQDLGLFLTEDTVFYMTRLGYIIPFINEMDLYCAEEYLNPQSPYITHLFHLCGGRGMFVASASRYGLLCDDVREGLDLEKWGIKSDKEWEKKIAKPMGSRIMEDEANAELFYAKTGNESIKECYEVLEKNEEKFKKWIDVPDFPILNSSSRAALLKQIAVKWAEKNSSFLKIEDFHSLLFEYDVLPEGKRTLAHVHEIVRAIMNSDILTLSDFNQLIPVSRLMGDAIILWMLIEEYNNNKESLETWLDRPGFSQKICRRLLSRLETDSNKNVLTSLYASTLHLIQSSSSTGKVPLRVIENAFELHIAIVNSPGAINFKIQPITGQELYDKNMSHKIIKNLVFEKADMQNTLFQQSIFIDCIFRECNLMSAYFAGSTFLDCKIEKTDLRNVDFSGSFFDYCEFVGNNYEDIILIGCSLSKNCILDLDVQASKGAGKSIWTDGAAGIPGFKKKYDLPVLIYLLQKRFKFYTRYGFKIKTDVDFQHSGKRHGAVADEKFLERYNYYDLYDEVTGNPELFFVKPGSIHYVRKGINQLNYINLKYQGARIDHVIKYREKDETGMEINRAKIIFHTTHNTFIEDRQKEVDWFNAPLDISFKFVGEGVSAVFLNSRKLLVATDLGGLFLFEQIEGDWTNIDSKFHSEPVTKIFPVCFENMVFVKRGTSVIEIWDTLNDLLLWSRLVTSFREVFAVSLVENLNHAIIYGEWADGSIGALAYNIINKHLITYWEVISTEEFKDFKTGEIEKLYSSEVKGMLTSLNEKRLRKVSLADGFIQKGCKEIRQIIDSLEIIPPGHLTYMEDEPVEFEWKIRSKNSTGFPINKTYRDVLSGGKVDFDFKIKIGDILSVQSGKLKIERSEEKLSVIWMEDRLEKQKESLWGDYNLIFKISLLGEEKTLESTFKIRPKNPFRGGESISKGMNTEYLFVGRKKELENAIRLIERDYSFSIKGARRIGKTSFINRLLESLPRNYWPVYISLDEFETSSSSENYHHIEVKIEELRKKYPGIYKELLGEALVTLPGRPIDFNWLIQKGLEKLKEANPLFIEDIWNELESQINKGKSGGYIYNTIIKYLSNFPEPPRIVFIIDEIGLASDLKIELKKLVNPFRPIIERREIIVILAGIPYNFDELTINADIATDSGLMSYINESILLGPLSTEECKFLIKNNLSKRIEIGDDVLDFAIYLSSKRPEDLQIIMQSAINNAIENKARPVNQNIIITWDHINSGFRILIEKRGHSCAKIWGKISKSGQDYVENKVKFRDKFNQDHLGMKLKEISNKDLSNEDISVFSGYGFTDPNEEQLVIPMYFQEWVRKKLYKKNYENKEKYYDEN